MEKDKLDVFYFQSERIISNLLRSQIFMPFGLDLLNYPIIFTENTPGNHLACCDWERIYINPVHKEILNSSNSEGMMAFLMLHEACHMIFDHEKRLGHRERFLWNLACDFMINLFLGHLNKESQVIESKIIKFPLNEIEKNCCYCQDFDNMIEEEIYDKLQKSGSYTNHESEMSLKDFLDKNGIPNDLKDDSSKIKINELKLDYKGKTFQQTEITFPRCAMSKEKQKEKNEQNELSKSMVQNSLLSRGLESSSFQKFLKRIFKVKVDWKIILSDAILTELQKSPELCWSTPRITWLANPTLPYLANYDDEEKYGTVVIGIDESGSMGDDDIRKAISIVQDSKEFFKNIYVIKHDVDTWTKLYDQLSGSDIDELLERKKCGGTSHKLVYEEINKFAKTNQNFISLCVFITDMCSDIVERQNILPISIPRIYLTTLNSNPLENVIGKVIEIK